MTIQTETIILDEIKRLSIELFNSNSTISRRELVDHINSRHPIANLKESFAINQLIGTAFNECSYSSKLQDSISSSFVTEDRSRKIYDPKRLSIVPKSLNLNQNDQFFNEIDSLFKKMNYALEDISRNDYFESFQDFENKLSNIKLVEVFSLTGASKVEEKSVEAKKIFENYRDLIDKYQAVKNELLSTFIDFEQLRNVLKYMREDLSTMLIEIFGENFKSTNPDLFQFATIKWMETDVLINRLQVEFANIQTKTQVFFQKYNQIYNDLGTTALTKLDNMNSSKGSLKNAAIDIGVEAIFSIMSSREESKATLAKLNYDIEVMKSSFWNDTKAIKLDVMRLLEIFRNVKENFSPTLQNFTTAFKNVYENQIKIDFQKIFEITGVREIKDANVNLMNKTKYLDIEISEVEKIITSSNFLKNSYKASLDSLEESFNYYIINEPTMPRLITNVLTLGVASRIFETMHKQWRTKSEFTRNSHARFTELLAKEVQRIKLYTAELKNYKTESEKCKSEIKNNSFKISQKLDNEPQLKETLALNIVEIINLSKISKEILEAKLEDRLIAV